MGERTVDRRYPRGTVRALIGGEFMAPATSAALRERLDRPSDDAGGDDLLATVCRCLIPQDDIDPPVDIAGELRRRLAAGTGDGWRYAELPDDRSAIERGLRGIDQTAMIRFGKSFAGLSAGERDDVLRTVQNGTAHGDIWRSLDPRRFFEELLAAAVEVFYAHPLAHEDIGFAGMADAQGWNDVSLGARASHEPAAIGGA